MGIWNGHGTFGDGIGDFGNEVWTEMRPTCMELEKGMGHFGLELGPLGMGLEQI